MKSFAVKATEMMAALREGNYKRGTDYQPPPAAPVEIEVPEGYLRYPKGSVLSDVIEPVTVSPRAPDTIPAAAIGVSTNVDTHRFLVVISDGFVNLKVACPYDMADTSRPCWPHHDEDDGAAPDDDTPEAHFCTYASWVDNESLEDLLHGEWAMLLEGAQVRWDGVDYFSVVRGDTPQEQETR